MTPTLDMTFTQCIPDYTSLDVEGRIRIAFEDQAEERLNSDYMMVKYVTATPSLFRQLNFRNTACGSRSEVLCETGLWHIVIP